MCPNPSSNPNKPPKKTKGENIWPEGMDLPFKGIYFLSHVPYQMNQKKRFIKVNGSTLLTQLGHTQSLGYIRKQ
jgi:hypothetical protein